MAAQVGATLASFDGVTWKRLNTTDCFIARPVIEADLVINLPKLKTHTFTLAPFDYPHALVLSRSNLVWHIGAAGYASAPPAGGFRLRRLWPMRRHELQAPSPLLDIRDHLTQAGWSCQPLLDCNLDNDLMMVGKSQYMQAIRIFVKGEGRA